jgi:pimeloyl-ACP methyl ester carboxylesterase
MPTPKFEPQSKDETRINNRRAFLRLTVGAVVGAAAMPCLGQPEKSSVPFDEMFKGFKAQKIQTTGATINVVSGGQGPPLLLLHGSPETHVMWHKIAPRLATEFTIFAADLRGYGDSSKPQDGENHSNYSKRAMAQDQIEVMEHFGIKKFSVVGHARGGRVGHRMALDYPDRITKLAVLDIVPTYDLLHRVSNEVATAFYHWFFLVQPYPFPETLIGANVEFYLKYMMFRDMSHRACFSSCLRFAAARSLKPSGLVSGTAKMRSSHSISAMVCSASISSHHLVGIANGSNGAPLRAHPSRDCRRDRITCLVLQGTSCHNQAGVG